MFVIAIIAFDSNSILGVFNDDVEQDVILYQHPDCFTEQKFLSNPNLRNARKYYYVKNNNLYKRPLCLIRTNKKTIKGDGLDIAEITVGIHLYSEVDVPEDINILLDGDVIYTANLSPTPSDNVKYSTFDVAFTIPGTHRIYTDWQLPFVVPCYVRVLDEENY